MNFSSKIHLLKFTFILGFFSVVFALSSSAKAYPLLDPASLASKDYPETRTPCYERAEVGEASGDTCNHPHPTLIKFRDDGNPTTTESSVHMYPSAPITPVDVESVSNLAPFAMQRPDRKKLNNPKPNNSPRHRDSSRGKAAYKAKYENGIKTRRKHFPEHQFSLPTPPPPPLPDETVETHASK